MTPARQIIRIIILGFFISVFSVSAILNSVNAETKEEVPAGYRYYPELRPAINTLDAAKKDLSELLSSENNPGIKYYGQPNINNAASEDALKALVQGKSGTITFWYDPQNELLFMAFSSISVHDDRIEVNPRIVFYYDDLTDYLIFVEKTKEWPAYGRHIVGKNMHGIVRQYKIYFPGLISFVFDKLADAQRFADDLFFIQQTLKKEHNQRRALFESRAARYRAMKIKPQVSEEQRRLIVQANAFNQRKKYTEAISHYLKAIDMDPISYPAAYFNLALLSAQMGRYKSAIGYMKQYLFLVPDAADARSAQDKIYEWEIMIQK